MHPHISQQKIVSEGTPFCVPLCEATPCSSSCSSIATAIDGRTRTEVQAGNETNKFLEASSHLMPARDSAAADRV